MAARDSGSVSSLAGDNLRGKSDRRPEVWVQFFNFGPQRQTLISPQSCQGRLPRRASGTIPGRVSRRGCLRESWGEPWGEFPGEAAQENPGESLEENLKESLKEIRAESWGDSQGESRG